MKAAFSWSAGFIMIWLYPEKESMKLSTWCPVDASTSLSIKGSGKLSLGQALFKFIKSTHSPFSTRLFYHDYIRQPIRIVYFLNKICFQNLFSFLFHDFHPVQSKLLFFCLTGLTTGFTFKEWLMIVERYLAFLLSTKQIHWNYPLKTIPSPPFGFDLKVSPFVWFDLSH